MARSRGSKANEQGAGHRSVRPFTRSKESPQTNKRGQPEDLDVQTGRRGPGRPKKQLRIDPALSADPLNSLPTQYESANEGEASVHNDTSMLEVEYLSQEANAERLAMAEPTTTTTVRPSDLIAFHINAPPMNPSYASSDIEDSQVALALLQNTPRADFMPSQGISESVKLRNRPSSNGTVSSSNDTGSQDISRPVCITAAPVSYSEKQLRSSRNGHKASDDVSDASDLSELSDDAPSHTQTKEMSTSIATPKDECTRAPWTCNLCNKTFAHEGWLKRHQSSNGCLTQLRRKTGVTSEEIARAEARQRELLAEKSKCPKPQTKAVGTAAGLGAPESAVVALPDIAVQCTPHPLANDTGGPANAVDVPRANNAIASVGEEIDQGPQRVLEQFGSNIFPAVTHYHRIYDHTRVPVDAVQVSDMMFHLGSAISSLQSVKMQEDIGCAGLMAALENLDASIKMTAVEYYHKVQCHLVQAQVAKQNQLQITFPSAAGGQVDGNQDKDAGHPGSASLDVLDIPTSTPHVLSISPTEPRLYAFGQNYNPLNAAAMGKDGTSRIPSVGSSSTASSLGPTSSNYQSDPITPRANNSFAFKEDLSLPPGLLFSDEGAFEFDFDDSALFVGGKPNFRQFQSF